jgi:hypothetical protein
MQSTSTDKSSASFWQEKVDSLGEQIKVLKDQQEEIKKEAALNGFFFNAKKFVPNLIVIGVITKWAYYSKYVGEKGAMYNYDNSAFEIEIDFEALKTKVNALKAKPPKEVELSEYFSIFATVSDFMGECLDISTEKSMIARNWWWNQKHPDKISEKVRSDCEKYFAMFSYEPAEDKVKFRYMGSSNQEEYVNGSGFDIGAYESRFLETYKGENFSDKFDAFDREVKW